MRILQLCLKPPLPAVDGGCMAMLGIAEGLLEAGHEVTILTLSTHKHPFLPGSIPATFKQATRIEAVFADTRVRKLKLLAGLLRSGSYNLTRFDVPAFHAKLQSLLAQEAFDVVHLESLYMTPYLRTIRQYSKAPVVVRTHNAEHQLWQRQAAESKSWLKRMLFGRIATQLKTDERRMLAQADGIAAIAETDAAILSRLTHERVPVAYIPFALNLPQHSPHIARQPFVLAHIGAMDWEPTAEGVRWLIREVWPIVYEANPEARLLLAGRTLREADPHWSGPGIVVLGEVENAHAFLQQAAVVAVPARTGSGVRIKLAEALALGCAVVSTTMGAEGIPVKEHEHLLLANDARAFAHAVLRLFDNSETAERLGENARHLAANELNRHRATEKLCDFYAQLIAAK
ncbi:MAG: glycosyltransferase family 4 protein [Bacteroidia bacterium]|jgi:glycosyltransferase involved in cell wall biosynthesis|nr:glycosyltransferase family 4 protein [Bacteroidia bacterium]